MAIETLVDKSCAELSEDVNEEGVLDGGDVPSAVAGSSERGTVAPSTSCYSLLIGFSFT